jgi:hypothetical protein
MYYHEGRIVSLHGNNRRSFCLSAALQELRAKLGTLESLSSPLAPLPFTPLPQGLPRGVLVELTGAGKTTMVLQLLAENPTLKAAWVEERFSLLPSAFPQRQVHLEKIFFVEGGKESAWAAGVILRSQLFPLLVYHAPYAMERELRRFQLLAERSGTTMLLLGPSPLLERAWPIRISLATQGRGLHLRRGR